MEIPCVQVLQSKEQDYIWRRIQISQQQAERQKKSVLQLCMMFHRRAEKIHQVWVKSENQKNSVDDMLKTSKHTCWNITIFSLTNFIYWLLWGAMGHTESTNPIPAGSYRMTLPRATRGLGWAPSRSSTTSGWLWQTQSTALKSLWPTKCMGSRTPTTCLDSISFSICCRWYCFNPWLIATKCWYNLHFRSLLGWSWSKSLEANWATSPCFQVSRLRQEKSNN